MFPGLEAHAHTPLSNHVAHVRINVSILVFKPIGLLTFLLIELRHLSYQNAFLNQWTNLLGLVQLESQWTDNLVEIVLNFV